MNTFKTLLFLPVILFSFCSSKSGTADTVSTPDQNNGTAAGQVFRVKGHVTNFAGAQLTLNELTTDGKMNMLDTATVDAQGNFVFEGFIREKTYALIPFANNNYVFLIIDSTSKIEVDIQNNQPVTWKVKGSAESEELQKIAQVNADYYGKLVQLNADYQNPAMASKQTEIEAKMTALQEELNTKMAEAVVSSKSPLAQVFAIEMMQIKLDKNGEEGVLAGIAKLPANKWFDVYKNHASGRLATAIGATAPEIALKNPEGQSVSLSSLKGKYVLIDFWASWCKPCRAENPNVVRMYNTYKSKGFEIFGVSLDNNAQAWKNAIAADGLTWFHVSDLGGWQSSAAQLYSVSSIPMTVLLDKEGKIIAKGLRGAELENKLKSLLN